MPVLQCQVYVFMPKNMTWTCSKVYSKRISLILCRFHTVQKNSKGPPWNVQATACLALYSQVERACVLMWLNCVQFFVPAKSQIHWVIYPCDLLRGLHRQPTFLQKESYLTWTSESNVPNFTRPSQLGLGTRLQTQSAESADTEEVNSSSNLIGFSILKIGPGMQGIIIFSRHAVLSWK